jgi:hypothetical protein
MILPADFDEYAIRRLYDEATETWWFSVVDIVQVLTQQPDDTTARKYWNKLKERLNREGSQLVTNCHQLKMRWRIKKNSRADRMAKLDICLRRVDKFLDFLTEALNQRLPVAQISCRLRQLMPFDG